jgi:hypothetical protein
LCVPCRGEVFEEMNETELVNQRETDEYDVDIGRSDYGESHMENTEVGEPGWLGNPYKKEKYGRAECILRFMDAFERRIAEDEEFRNEVEKLQGKRLGCWCVPQACHGEVIVNYLEE